MNLICAVVLKHLIQIALAKICNNLNWDCSLDKTFCQKVVVVSQTTNKATRHLLND